MSSSAKSGSGSENKKSLNALMQVQARNGHPIGIADDSVPLSDLEDCEYVEDSRLHPERPHSHSPPTLQLPHCRA
uniref:ELM2 domain-containing protein n=1 Tax=Panagrellus redivivus TaxID=6233 RepID=A0A7E4VC20_PANRE